jgi:hypothetical protein
MGAPGGDAGGDFCGQLVAAYQDLPDDELCDHYMALKSVLRERLQSEAAAGQAGGTAQIPGAAAAPAPAPAQAMAMAEGSASMGSMSKAEDEVEESSSSASMSKGSMSEGSASLSKDSVSAGHKSGGEMKAGKYPTKDGGAASDKEPFPAHDHGTDYPVSGKKGGKGAVEEGGTGRLEAVGKAKGSDSPDRLAAIGHVSKSEEFEAKLDVLTKAMELLLKTPQRKSVTDRWELAKAEGGSASGSKAKLNLTKTQLHEKLSELSKSEKLSSAERAKINSYYYGDISAESLSDLINKHGN